MNQFINLSVLFKNMDNLEFLIDYRDKKDREYLEYMLKKNVELLSVNAEILAEAGSDEAIGELLCLLQGLNNRY